MQVTNPVSPVTPAAPAAPARPADSKRDAFASLLRQSRSAQATPPETRAQGAEAATAESAADPADASAATGPASKARLKVADKASPQRPAERGPKTTDSKEAAPATAPEEPSEGTRAKRIDIPVAEPAMPAWLAAAQHALPTEAATRCATELDDADAAPASEPVAGSTADDTAALQDKAAVDTQARLETATAAQDARAQWAAATRADSATTQRAGQALVEAGPGRKPVLADTTPTAATLGAAAFNPLLGAARDSAAPLSVNLPTPLASPEFAQALGVQVSVLAADGVQRAELQLNPAEMGPVSVQIVIDGTSARVDFGADLAATRQVIEAGMPELAGALRDAGFTLAGGGVSQHAGNRGGSPQTPGDSGHGDRRGTDAEGAAVQLAPQRRSVAAGGVDLYA